MKLNYFSLNFCLFINILYQIMYSTCIPCANIIALLGIQNDVEDKIIVYIPEKGIDWFVSLVSCT